jgi:hypothetical protein|tara:strand:- start:19 stop:198 length:180 start_codon:yes stop_codon:yes gene_type:complete
VSTSLSAFLGLGRLFDLGRDFEVVTSSNRWQKQESLFQKREKNLEAEREKKTTVTRPWW